MAGRRRASGTAITPAPAITRCSCSTSLATSNAVLCVPATCTALTAGTTCSSPSWRATRARSHASIFADAAFAMPEVYEFLEAERIKYAIRLPANQVLQSRIGYLLARPVGRPPHQCAPVPCQFQLSGRNLDQAAEGYRQGRVASRRTLSPRRLHRDE